MTAIRPQPSPDAERRAQARERVDQILLKQPRFPFVLGVFYLALLIVPWALTCKIAREPSFIIREDEWDSRRYIQPGWVIAIHVLNSLAVVLSLPILSALLARAAVVFSQRRRPGQKLSALQLFALADRGWYDPSRVVSRVGSSALLRLGSLLLFMAIVLPPIRSGLVVYDNVLVSSHWPAGYGVDDTLGINANPSALKRTDTGVQTQVITATRESLRTTTGGIETSLWPVCNDNKSDSTCGFSYGPYNIEQSRLSNFWEADDGNWYRDDYNSNGSALMLASTLRAGSSIGTYKKNDLGAYTLGLKSGTRCETVSMQEVEEQCIRSTDSGPLPTAARGWNMSLTIPEEFSLNVCYPPLERDPWEAADASPWKPINFTEHLYVGLYDNSSQWGCGNSACGNLGTNDGLSFHCQADSLMSYFEIGSASTNGVPSRLLDEMPAGFEIPPPSRFEETSDSSPWDDPTTHYLGPLKTATMAIFGNDSWFDLLKKVMSDVETTNMTRGAALTILCLNRPLGNVDNFNADFYCEGYEYEDPWTYWSPGQSLSSFARYMMGRFKSRQQARATLNTATFFANNALLSQLTRYDYIHGTKEVADRMSVPVLSMAAIATVSILVGLQVVGIIILLVYIYRSRVWTETLDALAMARVGAQLSALDVFLVPRETGTLGPTRLRPRAAKQLEETDGLVGSTVMVGQPHDIEMATMPPPYAPRGEEPSTGDEQRMPQPGVAATAARDTATFDGSAPSYSPPANEHTTRAPGGEAEAVGGRGDSTDMAISHAESSEPLDAVLLSIEAVAVGGPGVIPRGRWNEANDPLPPRPAEQ